MGQKMRSLGGRLFKAAQKRAWKADFNQCSGRQLIRALLRAEHQHPTVSRDLPFVAIGHSKLFTRFNESSLRPFLDFIARHTDRFGWAAFKDFVSAG